METVWIIGGGLAVAVNLGIVALVLLRKTNGLLQQFLTAQAQTFDTLPKMLPEVTAKQVSSAVDPLVKAMNELANRAHENSGNLQQVSTKVGESAQEMAKLRSDLRQTHMQFAQSVDTLKKALHTLAQPGIVNEWLDNLPRLASPLQDIQASIDAHYQVNEGILKTTETLLTQWSEQGGTIEASSREIANSITSLATDELKRRRDAESEIRQYYQQAIERSEKVASDLLSVENIVGDLTTEVNTLSKQVHGIIQETSENTQKVVQAMDETSTLQKRIVGDQQGIAKTLKAVQTNLSASQQTMGQQLKQFTQQTQQANQERQEWGTRITTTYQDVIQKLETSQTGVAQRLNGALQDISTQKQQRTQNIILGGIAVLLAALLILIITAIL